MARAQRSLRALSVSTLEQRDQFTDLQLRLVAQDESGAIRPDAEVLLQVGGRWDGLSKRYISDADSSMVLGLHGGQIEAARFLARWFEAKARQRQLTDAELLAVLEIYSLLLHGGRREIGRAHV